MDSGNSGSMQSSSGGDEEYDSRGEAISTFYNPSSHFGSISSQQPPFLSGHHHHPLHQTNFFDPHSQNLDDAATFPQSLANTQFNNDPLWSRGLRSESNYANFANLSNLSSSSTPAILSSSSPSPSPHAPFATSSSSSSMPLQNSIDVINNTATRTAAGQLKDPNVVGAVKNPKKRTRASRRAPTTVLTTDTTNFRQMVQEFTGIPTAPFSGTGSAFSRRLDLFSAAGSAMRASGGGLDPLGALYPLRPAPQKIQLSPFLAGSSSPSLLNASVNPISSTTSNSSNFQHPPNLLNMQNPVLSFQPLLQTSLPPSINNPLGDGAPIFGTKSQGTSSNIHSLDGFPGSDHGPPQTRSDDHDSNISAARWRDVAGGTLREGVLHGDQEHLRSSFEGHNRNSSSSATPNLGGYKLNCSASSSEFHPEKGLENVCSGGGEGTVGSWTCTSD